MTRKWVLLAGALPTLLAVLAICTIDWSRAREASVIEEEWLAEQPEKIRNLGTTRTLEIVPLVNWRANGPHLMTEAGVAYLVRTDSMTILFDAGFNRDGLRPSPLERNMAALAVGMDEIDAVFVSHLHRDHVGGVSHERGATLSLGESDSKLAGRTMFTPVAMHHPTMSTVTLSGPGPIAPGVATTGPIARALVAGRIEEQALVVNVEGRGLVVIVGCGHQTLPKLIKRLIDAFDVPLYGMVGDLHYPVPQGRLSLWGIDAQRRLASGEGIFRPVTAATVASEMEMIDALGLGLIALGSHDTSDEVIRAFETRYGPRFRPVVVGKSIHVSPM